MGFRQARVSDLTGEVIRDTEVVTVIIKGHPVSEDNRIFDTTRQEIAGLAPVDDLVELELKTAGEIPVVMFVHHADLAAIVPDDKVLAFDSARGRRSGFRPGF